MLESARVVCFNSRKLNFHTLFNKTRVNSRTNCAAMEKRSTVKSRRKFVNLNPVFHKQTKNEEDFYITKQVIKSVRETGQLNLSNKHLSNVPPKVFSMYDSDEQATLDIDFSKTKDDNWWDFQPLTCLDLSFNVLQELPAEICTFQDLTILNLQDNCLVELPHEIGQLTSLTKLNLNRNKINKLPKEFFNLTELRTLSISNNCLETVDSAFSDLVMLENLDLSYNNIENLPVGLGYLVRLTSLNLSNNKLTQLPLDIVNMRSLLTLDLNNNSLKSLPDLGELSRLQILYASHNDITEIPNFEGCKKIEEIYLSNNFIKEFPDNFCETLPYLKILEMRDNQIETLPEEVILPHLVQLDLTNNELSTLPCSLSLLPHLQIVKVEGNKLKQIRPDIIKAGTSRLLKHLREKIDESTVEAFSKITCHVGIEDRDFPDRYAMRSSSMLNLAMQNLTDVPEEVFVEAKEAFVNIVDICKNKLIFVPTGLQIISNNLSELNLSFNQIKEIPEFLQTCSKLKYLNLANNLLNSLPDLGCLTNLKELVLSNNRFSKVPECVYKMIGLEILLLNDNNLTEIDVDNIKQLTRLANVSFANNNINLVPPELGNCTQIRSLELTGNPFRTPRYTILEQGTESVLAYLRDRIPK